MEGGQVGGPSTSDYRVVVVVAVSVGAAFVVSFAIGDTSQAFLVRPSLIMSVCVTYLIVTLITHIFGI